MTVDGMTAGRHIDYEALAREAMRGVVRAALVQVASSGLPGDHHFYVSFWTQTQGVGISKRLKDKYPEEMMIVLQHRFWDLVVTDDRFEVKLTFEGVPERLVVPFRAIKVFIDPSVPYGLQFEGSEPSDENARRGVEMRDPSIRRLEADAPVSGTTERVPSQDRGERRRERPTRRPRPEKVAEARPETPAPALTSKTEKPAPPQRPQPVLTEVKPAAPAQSEAPAGAKVVSLDQFRKK